jgi:site-specific DNA-methyltransferase (adenine-specific)
MSAPYYQDEAVTLYHGDWRELIPEDLTADLIVTDPPYGETSLDWDRWPEGWPTLAARHARSMWCFGSMRMFLDQRDEFADWRLSQDIVWEKHNGTGFASDRMKRVHELALHWYRGDWAGVTHETPREEYHGPDKHVRARNARPAHLGTIGVGGYDDDGTRLVRSVMKHQSVRSGINETEKPVPLLETLVQYGCPVGGTVLDFYAGSSAVLVAARNLGRRAVGFEKRESQCEAAAKRLAQGVLDFGEATA